MTESSYLVFVQCALGLETALQRELAAAGHHSQLDEGGVSLRVSEKELWALCLRSRICESVRLRLKSFVAKDFTRLEQGLKKLQFRAFVPAGTPVVLKVVCHQSRLWHSGAVYERALKVLTDYVGCVDASANVDASASVDASANVDASASVESASSDGGLSDEAQIIYLRLQDDEVQVSVDVGGPRMHRRGYRQLVERASLRETLAAALVQEALLQRAQSADAGNPSIQVGEQPAGAALSSGSEPLHIWDPFCGAGTIALEFAHQASGRLAGESRVFAFQRWRSFDADEFVNFRDQLTQAEKAQALTGFLCWGSDISEKAVRSAQENAQAAGLEGVTKFLVADVTELAAQIPHGALVITNAPYGKRLQDCSGVKKLVKVLAARPDLRPAVVLLGAAAKKAVPQSWPAALRFKNGGMQVSARLCLK